MMKKLTLIVIMGMLVVFLLFRYEQISALFTLDEPAMTFPEELTEGGCLGLNYHRVLPDNMMNQSARWLLNSDELIKFTVLTSELEEQMTALSDAGAVFLTEEELLAAKKTGEFPEKCVWVSIDDIDSSVYEHAFPILKEAGIPFTMFIIAGHVGNRDFSNLKMATWDELREMQESGLVSFGSHTYDMHRFEHETAVFLLPEQKENFRKDLQKSIQTIESELDIKVRSFAYPYGNTDDTTASIIEEEGLEAGYILAPQSIRPSDNNFHLNRIVINSTTFDEVILPFIKRQ
ncbi:polysaccharide deacetylase family protein [Paenisporosarcina sp. NPDC076898]|uniref:polysaccharide deacetylase family protein n=1 Tax=unclassified Paenisporosarcina TaxID=2642018 RepID=UPI003CFCA093